MTSLVCNEPIYSVFAKISCKFRRIHMWSGVETNEIKLMPFRMTLDSEQGIASEPTTPYLSRYLYFYASAFRRRRHYVFGLSVRPSVRSLKYPLLTCTWVRWSTRPTVTVLRHVRAFVRLSVRPSVRPERFPGICRRMHGGDGLKFYMLMYLDHLQNWCVYGYCLLICLIWALFWLSETGQIWGFRAFTGERIEEMAWNFARWCILTTAKTD